MSNVLRLFCTTLLGLLPQAVSAEEVTFYSAPYEVIEGDPSCNGPHERLVRVLFKVPDLAVVALGHPERECTVKNRRGEAEVEVIVPCPDETAYKDSVINTLNAQLEMCQSPFHNTLTSVSGEIAHNSSEGKKVLGLKQRAFFEQDTIPIRKAAAAQGTISLTVHCGWREKFDIQDFRYSGFFVVHFKPQDKNIASCTDDTCFAKNKGQESDTSVDLSLMCTELEKDPTQ